MPTREEELREEERRFLLLLLEDRQLEFRFSAPGSSLVGWSRPNTKPHAFGSFADVFRCEGSFSDGSKVDVAVKSFRLRFESAPTETEDLLKALNKEVDTWIGLQHPNIAPLLSFQKEDPICCISLWYENGNMAAYISTHQPDESVRLKLIHGVACGLRYLHGRQHRVVHGDLKPDNIMITWDRRAVIIDFGLSTLFHTAAPVTCNLSRNHHSGGNDRWVAPEVLMGTERGPSRKIDVYAWACVALYAMTERIPFPTSGDRTVVFTLCVNKAKVGADRSEYPKLRSDHALWTILDSCWEHDAEKRPTMEAIEPSVSELVDGDGD